MGYSDGDVKHVTVTSKISILTSRLTFVDKKKSFDSKYE
jgi:hypothetical protein